MINDFYLLLIRSDETNQIIKLNLQKYIVGRHSSCEVCIQETFLSRCHCTLILQQENDGFSYVLWDGVPLRNTSTSGTFLNGERLQRPIQLKAGDTITFAKNKPFPSLQFIVEETISYDATMSQELDAA